MICASDSLANGGKGIRFEIATECGPQSAFVVRHDGKAMLISTVARISASNWTGGLGNSSTIPGYTWFALRMARHTSLTRVRA
jgi:hypothetical protein